MFRREVEQYWTNFGFIQGIHNDIQANIVFPFHLRMQIVAVTGQRILLSFVGTDADNEIENEDTSKTNRNTDDHGNRPV